ncbi:PepSY domain-containing protein [Sphingomonas sp. IC081]|uniref:PepSY-associated TM helix domain-containing protein n=1 Tax=Sphingomonas sp. IC081 TaxID=304378 RepID=UPI001158C25B|nr:PepSY-associated TM helix domain-containing protein [Sphingomonas sp. IC081]QDK35116.1 PepSY domain-containing protein [Sphingomonas sp. IC081]
MRESLRQSMALVHTWTGLVLGWLLFAMFATGTSAYFQDEITRWMQPEITGAADPVASAQGAARYLERNAAGAGYWYMTLPNGRSATTQLFWQPADGSGYREAVVDEQGREVTVRETRGGYFLYRFHFDLHYLPVIWARYLVGIAAMLMLVAIISGVITHKKIFADFFMLRFGKGQRSWLDAHNVSAVLALPFHAMITFTGLVTLASMYMPWGVLANYAAPATFQEAVFGTSHDGVAAGKPASLPELAPLMHRAAAAWGGREVGIVRVTNPGDAAATIELTRASKDALGSRGEVLVFDVQGRQIGGSPAPGPAVRTESVMIGLHAGRFAQLGLRWLYFLSGIAGTIMVGSGLVLWTVKRRQRLPDPEHPHFGFRLVERLNVAAIAGLGSGIAAYFLANRLLPTGLAARADWEVHTMFLVWLGVLLWAVVRPPRRAWIEGLWLAAGLFGAVPVVNALTTSRGFPFNVLHGDWLFVGFDLVMAALAFAFGAAALKLTRRWSASAQAEAAPRRKTASSKAVEA